MAFDVSAGYICYLTANLRIKILLFLFEIPCIGVDLVHLNSRFMFFSIAVHFTLRFAGALFVSASKQLCCQLAKGVVYTATNNRATKGIKRQWVGYKVSRITNSLRRPPSNTSDEKRPCQLGPRNSARAPSFRISWRRSAQSAVAVANSCARQNLQQRQGHLITTTITTANKESGRIRYHARSRTQSFLIECCSVSRFPKIGRVLDLPAICNLWSGWVLAGNCRRTEKSWKDSAQE